MHFVAGFLLKSTDKHWISLEIGNIWNENFVEHITLSHWVEMHHFHTLLSINFSRRKQKFIARITAIQASEIIDWIIQQLQ